MSRDRRLGAGVGLLAVLVGACLVGPVLSPYAPSQTDPDSRNRGPHPAHPFGTGDLGEDVLTQVLVAGRMSLAIGLGAAAVATVVGGGLGIAAGWWGGWRDAAASRVAEAVLAVPTLVLALALAMTIGRMGPVAVVGVVALVAWPVPYRLARAVARRERTLAYVEAAQLDGATGGRLMVRHLSRAVAGELATCVALVAAGAMVAESALSFLGVGVDPESAITWGSMMADGQGLVVDRPWVVLFPAAALVVAVAAVVLIADALADRARRRHGGVA